VGDALVAVSVDARRMTVQMCISTLRWGWGEMGGRSSFTVKCCTHVLNDCIGVLTWLKCINSEAVAMLCCEKIDILDWMEG
jgi:hypothetical protein